MSYTLITDAGNFRAFKALIAAEYNGVSVAVRNADDALLASAEFAALSPAKRVPVLQTPKGSIFGSNAIAKFIARVRADSQLNGGNFYESGLIDSWLEFSANEIELPATLWFYPTLNVLTVDAKVVENAKNDLANALRVLENHLADKTYLVGEYITLADIAVSAALVYPFKFVAGPTYRAAFPNVVRWFTTLVNQPQFAAVIGEVVLAANDQAEKPKEDKKKDAKADKPKEEKKKEEKKKEEPKPKEDKKKKAEDDEEPEDDFKEEKKAEHPFKLLDKSNPSPFVMDTWKKTYSNCTDYKEAMDYFWANFDSNGWTLFRGDYKYNEECKVLFMTSNLIGGFIQRTEEIRKWLFGTMTIRGEEGKDMKVTAYYLIRGDSIKPLLDCNDDAECYEWTKVNVPASAEDKQRLYDYWCSEGPLDGEPCLDSRVYK